MNIKRVLLPSLFLPLLFVGFFVVGSSVQAATIYANSSSGNDTTGDGTSGTPYKTFDKAYTIASANDTIHLTGTFDWSDADETGDSSTSGYTIGKNLTITGQSVTSTIIQADSTDNTASKRVFTISGSVSTTISNITLRYGKVSGSGGCINATTDAIVTLNYVDLYSCRSTSYGGAVYAYSATTTVNNSSFYSNVSASGGGGLAMSAARLYLTNSTVYSNQVTGGGSGGGGIYTTGSSAEAYITNSTIALNTGNYGAGFNAYTSSNVYFKNSIVAGNTSGASATYNNFYKSASTYTSNGYNIFGYNNASLAPTDTTGDWTDANNDGTYDLNTVGTTGTLEIDTEGGVNDSLNGTKTIALLTGGIATNNATTTAHSIVAIPTTDQRGATRNSTTDIGSFELAGGGLSISAPTTQVTTIATTSIAYNQMDISWTNGNGSRRAIFMKAAGSGNASPVDGTRYNASSVFGSGDEIGSSGWYAIYDGISAESLTITGLSASTTYSIQAFEYNGIASGASVYFTDTASGNPLVADTYVPTTIYANSSTGDDGTGTGSSGAPYLTFHKAYTVATDGDTIDLTGTFTWTDAAETGDVSTSGYTIGKDLTITGQSATSTIIQAASTDNTASARVFTISSSVSTTFNNLSMRYGKTSSSGGCLYTNSSSNVTLNYVEVYSCRSTSNYGGGVYSISTTTISNSAIHTNTSDDGGGGVHSANGSNVIMTNSTVYGNTQTSGSGGGAGIYLYYGDATLTNVTVTNNTGSYGGGISVYWGGVLNIKNSIVAENTGNSASNNDFYYQTGAITSGGYNIIGSYSGFSGTTGDWTDTNRDGTFDLNTVGTTGSLFLDVDGGLNDSLFGTRTFAITTSTSIVFNNATTTAHNGYAIPTTDQRGATRSGATDIGAFEIAGGGLSISAPTTQITTIATTSIAYNQMDISWTNGSGSRRVLFMKATSTGNAVPVDGTRYTDSSVFGSGDQISSSGWYAIYDGIASTTMTITGLSPSTTYSIQGFEYNGVADGASVYFTDTASGNPLVASTYVPTTIYANSSGGNDDTGDGSSGNPYQTFDKAYTIANGGDTINLTGTFDWSDAAEDGDASTTGYTIGKDITIVGQGADQTFVQAASADDTATARVFTFSANVSSTIERLTIRYGKQSSTGGGCVRDASTSVVLLQYVEMYNCRVTQSSSNGGGVLTTGAMTIVESAVYDNYVVSQGGGVATGSGSTLVMTNSTVYGNTQTGGSGGGAGVLISYGTGTLTNVTVTGNSGAYGGGISVYSGGTLNIKNSIVAGNTGNSASNNNFYNSGSTITSGGYNIIENYSSFVDTTGDWTDDNNDGTYSLYTIGTTGSLNLDTAAGNNDNPNHTNTWAVLENSIAINNATTTAHGSVSIPSTDQRTAARVAGADIGSFEYGGVLDDITAPTVSYFNPADNATDIGVTTTFEINFDENIATSTGNIILYKTSDDSLVETIDITSALVTASSTTALIIDPSSTLASETEYYFMIDATAVDDTSGNSYAGITASTTWSFTTADVDNPTVLYFNPADNATGVGVTSTFEINFNEDIATSTGNIILYKTSDDSLVETIDITSALVTASSTTALIIDPSSTLASETEYYFMIDATAVDDTTGNSFAGITASTTWSFTTADIVNPAVTTLSPLDDATGVAIDANFVVTFDEVVDAESGNISLYKTSDDSLVEAIDVTGGLVTGSGSTEITINPTSDLGYETAYYVFIAATAFDDTSSNSYAGIAVSSTWSFTTTDTPLCSSISNAATYNAYPSCGVATCHDGYELTGGACVAVSNGGGGAPPPPAPSVGSGNVDAIVPMGISKHVGLVGSSGTNIMTYIFSQATFDTVVSNNAAPELQSHQIEIIALDLFSNIATIQLSSEPQVISLALDEQTAVDLDGDGVKDVLVAFEDIVINRVELTITALLESSSEEQVSDNVQTYEGTLITYPGSPKVYRVEDNHKRWIVSEAAFNHYGYDWGAIQLVDVSVVFQDGDVIDVLQAPESVVVVPSTYVFDRDLEQGIGGGDVQELQRYLNTHGYPVASSGYGSVGNETTYFGSATKAALMLFQEAHALPAFGYFGPMTRALIAQ